VINLKNMKNYTLFLLISILLMSSCWSHSSNEIDPNIILLKDINFEKSLINQKIDTDGITNGQISRIDAENTKTINVANQQISSLIGIEGFINLIYLDCSQNNLKDIDVSKNAYLESLDCSANQLEVLNLNNNPGLAALNCRKNALTTLTLNNKQLLAINADDNAIKKVEISACINLNLLTIATNKLTELAVGNSLKLRELRCNSNQLSTIDLSRNQAVSYINISNNLLQSLSLCSNLNLTTLICTSNNLKTVSVSKESSVILVGKNVALDNQTNLEVCK
jgi:hypothetical protein